ncbi:hypothetical protein F2Q68_00020341 [Brassica cretica]|uniref:Uncharacterized protein n=1 Tax=Brassica cretica TaxID=69181 RepID=A0A8S9FSF5_BRACR|nr:hypothetical protein F2Q68_00020341 [Brassica cretica]
MFDVLAETNPALAAMWQNLRPTINPDPTPACGFGAMANRTHIRSIAGMFNVLAETNPALAAMWQNVRPTINPDPTPEEHVDLEQWSVHHSAEIFDDINLNS